MMEIPKGPLTYDYERLAEVTVQCKNLFPEESVVEIVPEPGIPLGVVANALIKLRGEQCRLPIQSEAIAEECSFWTPVTRLPDETMRSELAVTLMARGVPLWDAMYSSMDHLAPGQYQPLCPPRPPPSPLGLYR